MSANLENSVLPFRSILIKDMMNTNFKCIYKGDSIRDVIRTMYDTKLDTLPVVDADRQLIGVISRWSVMRALLHGKSIDDSCNSIIITPPFTNSAEKVYRIDGMLEKAADSPVGMVPVLDSDNNIVGMLGKNDYMREIMNSSFETLAFIDAVFQGILESIIATNCQGRIMMVNPSAERMFSLPSAETVKGKFIEDVLQPLVFKRFNFSDTSTIPIKGTINHVPVIGNAVPILTKQRQVGVCFVLHDISLVERVAKELKSTKELQTTLASVLNSSQDCIFVSDNKGIIKYVNDQTLKYLVHDDKSPIGTHINNYIDSCSYDNVFETLERQLDVVELNGQPCLIFLNPVFDDDNNSLVGVITRVIFHDEKFTEEFARKYYLLKKQVQFYKEKLEKRDAKPSPFDQIITFNDHIRRLKQEAQRVAKSSSTVLLTGESGVGKDMFARAIHASSPRASYPFIKVNCAAIPETLLESELFGYAPGSFTGAAKKGKPGYFHQANHGTLFLDEIGDMPLSFQVKLLQVLQDKHFTRIGGTEVEHVDVRIIAATNRDLAEAIANNEFREDLYYRLNVIEFYIPPLRERREDIIPLAKMFIEKYDSILGSVTLGISKEAQNILAMHKWPGNIRELQNAMERAANFAWEREIIAEDLPPHMRQSVIESSRLSSFEQDTENTSDYRETIHKIDKAILINALQETKGNKSAAARLLNLSRSALYEKLAKYGLK